LCILIIKMFIYVNNLQVIQIKNEMKIVIKF